MTNGDKLALITVLLGLDDFADSRLPSECDDIRIDWLLSGFVDDFGDVDGRFNSLGWGFR